MQEKYALITGGNKGIGKAIALTLAQQGYHILVTGRDKASLENLCKEVLSLNQKAFYLAADMEEEDTPEKIAKFVSSNTNALDVLVNNVGFAISEPFESTQPQQWDRVMKINARAPFFVTSALLKTLRNAPQATVINISSAVGRMGYVDQAAYGASKHALMGWTKSLAKEVQKDGIRVHVIAPGGVATDMISRMRPDLDQSELMQPQEIANIAWFLIQTKGNATIDEINVRRFSGTAFQ